MWGHTGEGDLNVSVREINNELGHRQGSCFIHYNQRGTGRVQSMRSGVQLCAMYVCVVKVYACTLCLRVSFMCAWMNSGRQELAPERNSCVDVYTLCVLHECAFECVCTHVYFHMQRWISVYLGCSYEQICMLVVLKLLLREQQW